MKEEYRQAIHRMIDTMQEEDKLKLLYRIIKRYLGLE